MPYFGDVVAKMDLPLDNPPSGDECCASSSGSVSETQDGRCHWKPCAFSMYSTKEQANMCETEEDMSWTEADLDKESIVPHQNSGTCYFFYNRRS